MRDLFALLYRVENAAHCMDGHGTDKAQEEAFTRQNQFTHPPPLASLLKRNAAWSLLEIVAVLTIRRLLPFQQGISLLYLPDFPSSSILGRPPPDREGLYVTFPPPPHNTKHTHTHRLLIACYLEYLLEDWLISQDPTQPAPAPPHEVRRHLTAESELIDHQG